MQAKVLACWKATGKFSQEKPAYSSPCDFGGGSRCERWHTVLVIGFVEFFANPMEILKNLKGAQQHRR
jgi:hypothetical protein